MIAVFTQTPSDTKEIVVKPRGISRSISYCVSFDSSQETICVTGNELVSNGIVIRIDRTMSSEMILIEEKCCPSLER